MKPMKSMKKRNELLKWKHKKNRRKKVEPSLEDKIDTIYEILSQHKIDIEFLGKKVEEQSSVITKVRGRMGI